MSAPSSRVVTIAYVIDAGAATTAALTEAITGTITFLPGETHHMVSVPIAALGPARTTLTISLHSATYATLGTATSIITIIDEGRYRLFLPLMWR